MSQDRYPEPDGTSPVNADVPDEIVNIPSGDAEALDLPAPEIDLGGTPSEAADKPLGPRRLALLREQMEQHQKELEQNQSDDPEHVDPDLAMKQRRMAELASRAALASEEDRATAERASASRTSDDGAPVPPVPTPASAGSGSTATGARAADRAESDGESSGPASDTDTQEPGQPVSALDAEGLELLEPSKYRESGGGKTFLLVLAAVVLLALAVVILLILL
ncbi:hypothetical protein GWK18_01010 [Kocuria sp. JC486]|uniref:hypothetical protein n=1 Tax=Kocuria sp. JC486 TaxID=1970736 RepID=UPI001423C2EB|nr:hypothetical protein [Kocuria sp. JC486]NHU84193.1 hypothetical protein [Kocuria sp. JC486]